MPNIKGDIQNRPKELWTLANYSHLPDESFQIDLASAAGEFLANDIFDLDGVQPLESAVLKLSTEFFEGVPVVGVNPSKDAIEYYRERGDTFQMVNVVVCCHSFERRDGKLFALPYHVSLRPAMKNGSPQTVGVGWIANFDLEKVLDGRPHYMGFNPFSDAFGLYALGPVPVNEAICSDVIGFVYNTYFVASKHAPRDASDPGLCTELLGETQGVLGDYRKYRCKNYFKKFTDSKPLKIWGCDSPIELFLLQAMSQIGLHPKIQMLIYPDGTIFPSLQSMWEGGVRTARLSKIITEADFFFEKEKVAVFCDSKAHHTSADEIAKDQAIDQKLAAVGIRSYRVAGTDIADSPFRCAALLKEFLSA
ncbi:MULTISPECIES: hypothetical protein [unclassified Pseudomonas]|uniref:hypothetical protein n=1 Tax=unclassified Pseudomonas TaxID=196821 RepID=UPI000CD09644|nr:MULTISPECIES: hypothetical protein [unclassified Pseudomonas]POA28175.1 hypothetical protein C1887_24800 [Pseudomonas sp. GW456-R21]POA62134.1 hypothetical protein C1884_27495 [Pseudomonas sp. GW460-R15]